MPGRDSGLRRCRGARAGSVGQDGATQNSAVVELAWSISPPSDILSLPIHSPSSSQHPPCLHSAIMSSAEHHDDELTPEQTEGFKVGEKKTIDEYQQLGE